MSVASGQDRFSLRKRRALVTGASQGLGYAIAEGLGEAGAEVVITDHNDRDIEGAVTSLRDSTGACVYGLGSDLSIAGSAIGLVQATIDLVGSIDVLVANAGISVPESIIDLNDETWDRTIAVNLTSVMELTRAVAPSMSQQGWGRIIYTSSTFGEVSLPQRAAYSASKAGLRGLARASASDLGRLGITVNCIAPGPFITEQTNQTVQDVSARELIAESTVLGRWGTPSEIAGAVVLLASDAGSFITGTTIFVDGGYTAN
jgi:NAD(P)-dependent dehydrogenase (short-subunit alcohol dehydrogenase family)